MVQPLALPRPGCLRIVIFGGNHCATIHEVRRVTAGVIPDVLRAAPVQVGCRGRIAASTDIDAGALAEGKVRKYERVAARAAVVAGFVFEVPASQSLSCSAVAELHVFLVQVVRGVRPGGIILEDAEVEAGGRAGG